MVTELQPTGGCVKKRNLCPWRPRTRDLFKIRGSSAKSFRKILRLGGKEIDLGKQRRRGMKRARVIQNRNRLIEVFVLDFESREFDQSRGDGLRSDPGVTKICK